MRITANLSLLLTNPASLAYFSPWTTGNSISPQGRVPNFSLLPTRPASEQIRRSDIEHALRVIFRKLDRVHNNVRVIDIIQWLLEATRPPLKMNFDVSAEAMLQKTECGHARHEESRWRERDIARPFCAGKPFQRNPVIRAPKLHWHFSAWKYPWIKSIAPVAVDILGVIPSNLSRANRLHRLPIQEYLKAHDVIDQSHANDVYFLRSQGELRPPLEPRIVYLITHLNESEPDQLRMNSWATPTACRTNDLIIKQKRTVEDFSVIPEIDKWK